MSNVITQQDADAAITRSHAETAARTAATANAEAQRRQGYRDQMAAAVAAQGAPSRPSTPGEGIRTTPETARHIAQLDAQRARANALSGLEKIEISGQVSKQLYTAALAAGKPLPASEVVQRAQRDAIEAAITQRLTGAA